MVPEEFVRICEVVSGQEDCCLMRWPGIISLEQWKVGHDGYMALTG